MRNCVLAWCLLAVAASASEIVDHANCFTPAAKEAALARLNAAEAKSGIPIVIETFASAPRQSFDSPSDKDRFFQAWLRDVAKERDAQGYVILLCLDPGRVQVDFHQNLYAQGYHSSEHAEVRDTALPYLKRKDFDAALEGMVNTVVRQLEAPRVASNPSPPSVPASPRPAAPTHSPPITVRRASPSLGFIFVLVAVAAMVGYVLFQMMSAQKKSYRGLAPKPPTLDIWPPVKCESCGNETRREICEACGRAVPRERPVPPVSPASSRDPVATNANVGMGHDGFLTGMILGQLLSPPNHHGSHYDTTPARHDPPSSPPMDSGFGGGGFGGGGGFDGGGFSSGGGFSGGSGGDF